jgi:hypothetical protein
VRIRRLSLSVASLLLIAAFSADAQPPVSTSARVVRATAVLEQPLGDARSVGTVVIGEILDVLDERNGWYLVRPPAGGPAREWRTGWVNGGTVEPMRGGAAAATVPAPPPVAASQVETSSNRKGFIIGGGAGGGLHRPPGFTVVDRFGRVIATGGGTNNFSVVTNFAVGYAPSDQLLLFYSNRAVFTTDESYDALGVTGFGTTYMFRRRTPSAYVTGSIGGGFGANIVQGTGGEAGLGYSVGGGWEFARHLSVEGDVLFIQFGNDRNHIVYRGLFNYTFY